MEAAKAYGLQPISTIRRVTESLITRESVAYLHRIGIDVYVKRGRGNDFKTVERSVTSPPQSSRETTAAASTQEQLAAQVELQREGVARLKRAAARRPSPPRPVEESKEEVRVGRGDQYSTSLHFSTGGSVLVVADQDGPIPGSLLRDIARSAVPLADRRDVKLATFQWPPEQLPDAIIESNDTSISTAAKAFRSRLRSDRESIELVVCFGTECIDLLRACELAEEDQVLQLDSVPVDGDARRRLWNKIRDRSVH